MKHVERGVKRLSNGVSIIGLVILYGVNSFANVMMSSK